MNKGLDLIARQQPEFINDFPTGNISIGVTKEELTELEKELKEYEQYKAIEKELGISLIEFFKHIYLVDKKRKEPPFMINTLETLKQNRGKTWASTKEELEK